MNVDLNFINIQLLLNFICIILGLSCFYYFLEYRLKLDFLTWINGSEKLNLLNNILMKKIDKKILIISKNDKNFEDSSKKPC